MINFRFLLAFLISIIPLVSNCQTTDLARSETATKNLLAPYNPGFESGKAKWTASGGTFAVTSSSPINGKQHATWDSSSASQTLTSTAVSMVRSGNCEASILIATPSGTATHLAQAYDGTNVLASVSVVSSTVAREHIVYFPCPSSGTVSLRLISVASDEPSISIDDAYLGLARGVSQVSQASLIASAVKAGTTSCAWSRTNTALGDFSTDADCPAITVVKQGTIGTIVTTDDDLPQIVINNLPPGEYLVLSSFQASYSAAATQSWALTDGTTTRVQSVATDGTVVPTVTLSATFSYTVAGSRTFKIQAASSSGSAIIANGTSGLTELSFQVFRFPTDGQTVINSEVQGWFAAGYISGADPGLSTSTQALTEITNGSLVLTQSPGSTSVGIACASGTTNTAGATTCASANESVGVTVSVPVAGSYRVCFRGTNYLYDSGSGTNVNVTQTFQVNQTSAASSTVVTSGNDNVPIILTTNSGGGAEVIGGGFPFNSCPVFQLSSGTNTFRLMYASSISGTLGTNNLQASGGVGTNNIYFRIEPVNSQQSAILANSVSTGRANGNYDDYVIFGGTTVDTSCTSTPCGYFKSSGSWVSQVTRSGTGLYSIDFTGRFSDVPSCICNTWIGGSDLAQCSIQQTNANGASIYVSTKTGGALTDARGTIRCTGPR